RASFGGWPVPCAGQPIARERTEDGVSSSGTCEGSQRTCGWLRAASPIGQERCAAGAEVLRLDRAAAFLHRSLISAGGLDDRGVVRADREYEHRRLAGSHPG